MQTEADMFKAIGDPTRLRLLTLLCAEGERCVCQLAQALDEPEQKISRHLGVLRAAGLVATRREGTWIHYRPAQARCAPDRGLQQLLRRTLSEHPTIQRDRKRLAGAVCA